MKKWPLKTIGAALFLFLSGSAFGCNEYQGDCCQPRCDSCCSEVGVYLDARFLYWKAQEDQLDFVQEISATPFAVSGTTTVVDEKTLDFKWKPGFQIAIGAVFPQWDCWDLSLSWTYLHSHATNSASTSDPSFATSFLQPSWFPSALGSIADEADAHWSLNFNTVDLSLGRTFCPGSCFAFHPYAGLRGAWIDQNYNVNYHSGFQFTTDAGDFLLFSNTSLRTDTDFKAVGPRVGFDFEWMVTSQWSVLANASGSLLYGKFNCDETFNGIIPLVTEEGIPFLVPDTIIADRDFHRLRANVDGQLGLRWQRCFACCDCPCRLMVSGYYDVSYWFDQNVLEDDIVVDSASGAGIESLITSKRNGNLDFHGFSGSVRVDTLF